MRFLSILTLSLILLGCKSEVKELPIIGQKKLVDGKEVPHMIPNWKYTDEQGHAFSDQDLSDHVYIADFFFTSCPAICPKVMKEMVRFQEEFKDDPRVKLVSFTLDPKRDTPEKLSKYANNIGAIPGKWKFLAGDMEETFDLANEYFVVAYADDDVPGGFDHSGKLLLVDKNGHVRSFSEGTDPSTTPKLIADTKQLLASYDEQ